jgi:hypothetical protein
MQAKHKVAESAATCPPHTNPEQSQLRMRACEQIPTCSLVPVPANPAHHLTARFGRCHTGSTNARYRLRCILRRRVNPGKMSHGWFGIFSYPYLTQSRTLSGSAALISDGIVSRKSIMMGPGRLKGTMRYPLLRRTHRWPYSSCYENG